MMISGYLIWTRCLSSSGTTLFCNVSWLLQRTKDYNETIALDWLECSPLRFEAVRWSCEILSPCDELIWSWNSMFQWCFVSRSRPRGAVGIVALLCRWQTAGGSIPRWSASKSQDRRLAERQRARTKKRCFVSRRTLYRMLWMNHFVLEGLRD